MFVANDVIYKMLELSCPVRTSHPPLQTAHFVEPANPCPSGTEIEALVGHNGNLASMLEISDVAMKCLSTLVHGA